MERDDLTPYPEDGVVTEVGTVAMVAEDIGALDRVQLDTAIATAKKWPRSVQRSIDEAQDLALMDPETAETMFYILPRGNKDIIGPSVHLAVTLLGAWGNARAESAIVDEDRTHVTAMGTAFDLEKNVAVRVRVKRRITDKKGRRFNEDMIGVTSNAAISVALRNAILKVIPKVYVDRIFKAAMKTAAGDEATIAGKRERAMSWFGERGIKPEQIYVLLGVGGLEEIGVAQILRLRGIVTAIKERETTLESLFAPAKDEEATKDLDDALKKDHLATEIIQGVYDGKTIRQVILEEKGRAWVRRYVLPTLIGDPKAQVLAALDEAEDTFTRVVLGGDVEEAYRKALDKSTKLLAAGAAFSLDEGVRLDELRSAADFDGLIELDEVFARRLIEAETGGAP